MSKIPGEFVPLDVRYRRDRAIRRAGAEAELLYIRSLTLAKREETGGVIEDYDIPELTEGLRDPDAAIRALVDNHLWVKRTDGAWLIRSWEKWNPAIDPSASGTLGNHNRWHRDRGIIAPDCPHCKPDVAPESVEGSPPNRPDADPIIAPDVAPESVEGSQSREEKTREEKNSSASQANAGRTHLAPVDAITEDFTEWWSAYPRKRDKKPAEKAYRSARKRASAAALLAGAEAYAKEVAGRDPSKVKHGSTWLNGDCWLNEPEMAPDSQTEESDEEWRERQWRAPNPPPPGMFDLPPEEDYR